MKRVAVYARVSSDRQEREETIDSQLDKIRELAAQKQLTILERHIYLDDGYPGEMLARPALDRLRDDARDGLLDVVIIYCPDRLARRYAYQVVIIEEIEKHGCEVYFVNRPIADTPEDQMLLAMQGVIAEYERAKIMERTRRGRLHKARIGVLVTSAVPYGYRYFPRRGTERARAEIAPDQAAIVRDIFRWVVEEDLALLAVSRRLMDRGIASPKGGVRWATSTIHKMLRNRTYIGELCANKLMAVEPATPPQPGVYRRKRKCAFLRRPPEEWIVIPVPAIVDRKTFEAAGEKLVRNQRFARRHLDPRRQALLRCLVRCGECGYSMPVVSTLPRPKSGKIFMYYTCLKHWQSRRYGDCQSRCPMAPVKTEVLDEIVWNDLRDLLSDPERIAHYAGLTDKPDDGRSQEIERLARETESCDRQLQRLVDAYQRGAIEVDDLLARRHELSDRKSVLAESLKREQTLLYDAQLRSSLRAKLPELMQRVRRQLQTTDFETRQQLVRLLIDRVVVMPDRSVEINYLLPVTRSREHPHRPKPESPSPGGRAVSGISGLRPQPEPPLAPRLRSPIHQPRRRAHPGPAR